MPVTQTKIKLAVVDDHKLFRKGIVGLIDLYYSSIYEVLFEAEDGNELIKKLNTNELPDIVILDIEMPGLDGYEAVSYMTIQYPELKSLVISQVDREEAIIRMLKLGVKGFLSKNIDPGELHTALQAIFHKGFYYTDFITGKLIHSLQQEAKHEYEKEKAQEQSNDIFKQLNEREREFLQLSCSELTYEQIAKKMFLSPKTIDGYRSNLFEKFHVSNRIGLVLFAIKSGIIKI